MIPIIHVKSNVPLFYILNIGSYVYRAIKIQILMEERHKEVISRRSEQLIPILDIQPLCIHLLNRNIFNDKVVQDIQVSSSQSS